MIHESILWALTQSTFDCDNHKQDRTFQKIYCFNFALIHLLRLRKLLLDSRYPSHLLLQLLFPVSTNEIWQHISVDLRLKGASHLA